MRAKKTHTTVTVNGVDRQLWREFKAKAKAEGLFLSAALVRALRVYLGGNMEKPQ